MKIKLLDVVKLKDGRRGTVVEVYGKEEAFDVEFLDSEGYTTSIEMIERDKIVEVVWVYPGNKSTKAA